MREGGRGGRLGREGGRGWREGGREGREGGEGGRDTYSNRYVKKKKKIETFYS